MGYLKRNSELCDRIDTLGVMGASIGYIGYLPILDANSPPKKLHDFFEDTHELCIARLNEKFKGIDLAFKSFEGCSRADEAGFVGEFISDLHSNCDYPYLVEVKLCQNVYSVRHNEDNAITGYGGVWNSYSSTWVFAESMEDAIAQATVLGEANLRMWLKKLE